MVILQQYLCSSRGELIVLVLCFYKGLFNDDNAMEDRSGASRPFFRAAP
jgi:hypothetical protein